MRLLPLKLLLIATVFILSECGKPKEGSAVKKAVEDATGITTIKKGEMMKEQLRQYEKEQEQREKEINDIK